MSQHHSKILRDMAVVSFLPLFGAAKIEPFQSTGNILGDHLGDSVSDLDCKCLAASDKL